MGQVWYIQEDLNEGFIWLRDTWLFSYIAIPFSMMEVFVQEKKKPYTILSEVDVINLELEFM